MIIKEIELDNIRSYGHATLRFPLGRTLLEGDIGSGKSSVLMAIEFALFGLGSEAGASILKLGRETGMVRVVFDVDGFQFEVTRRLERRGGRVQQAEGTLSMSGETLNLSPTELKEKVLELLEFNEAPDPKSQSWIYRYAVYTAQEEMKGILSLAPEQRLQILRRAFRIEDYKTAASNAEDVARGFRGDIRELKGRSAGIEGLRARLEGLLVDEREGKKVLEALSRLVEETSARLVSLKSQRDKLREEETKFREAEAERKRNEKVVDETESELGGLDADIREARGRMRHLAEELKETEESIIPDGRGLTAFMKDESSLGKRIIALTALRAKVESKVSDYQSIMKNGVCPVCDTRLPGDDLEKKVESKSRELAHLSGKLTEATSELEKSQEKRARLEQSLAESKNTAAKRSEHARVTRDLVRMETSRTKMEAKSDDAKKAIKDVEGDLKALDGVLGRSKTMERAVVSEEEELRKLRDGLASRKERLDAVSRRQAEVRTEISEKERAEARGKALGDLELWLGSYFVPTVQLVERSVLASINQEFNALLQKWFGMLVSDPDKEVRVDEEFTPLVSQAGYEQDIRYLSGGERTSVALAFRLALNVLAQRASVGMKSNLLILDEPTDGFSKEQLGSVREVLDDIASPQFIIVSHDKELESFADQIMRVRKDGDGSIVEGG